MVLEGDLIAACRRGERDAFRALFETYQDRVYSIALRYTADPAAALDIAQDVFLKLLSSIQNFRGDSGFETWLYRLVVNRCLDHRRRARRVIEFFERFAAPTALHDLLREEAAQDVQGCIARLPADQRIVIVLRYTEGLSYEQIAEILGCSQGTVGSRLNRAHKTLERHLAHLRGRK
jgi:RNA polymerase sigma-70 factor (ECF subfamily)